MRIVDLDGNNSEGGSKGTIYSRNRLLDSSRAVRKEKKDRIKSAWYQTGTVNTEELSTPRATSPVAPESPLSPGGPARSPSQATADFSSPSRRHRNKTESPQSRTMVDPELSYVALSPCSSPRRPSHEEEIVSSAEAYRRRLEALKKDMGEGWLQIYSQTEVPLPS